VELVRRLRAAAERRDSEAVFALYDPDIVWSSAGSHGALELGGSYHGHDGVRQFFRDFLESFKGYQAHAEKIEEAGDRVLVGYRVSGRGKGSGGEVAMRRWNVYGVPGWSHRPCGRLRGRGRGPRSRRAARIGTASFASRFARPS
jgi:ketosteroid isomerase-like protein